MFDRLLARQWIAGRCRAEQAIDQAYLFGSFLKSNEIPADVDLLCAFNISNVRIWSSQTKSQFLAKFGKPLHLQRFHKNDVEEIAQFLEVAKVWEKVT